MKANLELILKEVKNKLKVGKKYKIDYGKNNSNNKVIHIRAFVDDEYVVYRYWSRRKNRYYYLVEWFYGLYLIKDIIKEVK